MKFINSTIAAAVLALGSIAAGAAHAGTIIYNNGILDSATVALGVNNDGSLNTTPNITENADLTGLAYNFGGSEGADWRDATAPGCFCEGWGVSVNGTTSGHANVELGGSFGLTAGVVSNVTPTSVTTTTSLSSLTGLTISQAYAVSGATSALFQNTVTIKNTTGAAVNDVKYVRVMDWDIPPTEFSEYVTIKGTATTTLLERSHDDGFASSDPLVESSGAAGTLNVDFTDNGPRDHGAYFRFNFGTLEDGEEYTFNIFYGAAGNETDALAAIGAAGIELYSLGQSSTGGVPGDRSPTFIFGFSGVGGTPQEPGGEVPEPGSLALVGLALAGLCYARRRKQA